MKRRTRRPHCSCTDPQNISIQAAAAKLACGERWLLDQLRASVFPHQKCGERRVMCPCDLLVAMELCAVEPVVEAPEAAGTTAPVLELHTDDDTAAKIRTLRPAQGRATASG